MFKRVHTTLGPHKIEVSNSWFTGAKLFIDGQLVSKNHGILALDKKKVQMKAVVQIDGVDHSIEVFAWAPFISVKLKICADGQQIGGDKF